jgi:hypothetical protein
MPVALLSYIELRRVLEGGGGGTGLRKRACRVFAVYLEYSIKRSRGRFDACFVECSQI